MNATDKPTPAVMRCASCGDVCFLAPPGRMPREGEEGEDHGDGQWRCPCTYLNGRPGVGVLPELTTEDAERVFARDLRRALVLLVSAHDAGTAAGYGDQILQAVATAIEDAEAAEWMLR